MCWLVPFGVLHGVLIPQGYGMFGASWVGGLFFAAAATVGLMLYRREARDAQPGPGSLLGPALVLSLTCVVTAIAYALVPARLPLSPESYAQYEQLQIGLVRMDTVYLGLKLPELVFQQALIWVLVRRLQAAGHAGWALVGAFALVFGGIHLPIIGVKGLAGVPFILAAAGASLLFVPLIARFRGGVGYSFSVHLIAYVIAGIGLRLQG